MSTCSRRGGRQPRGVKAGAQGPRGSLSVPPPMRKVSTKGVKGDAETKTAQRGEHLAHLGAQVG